MFCGSQRLNNNTSAITIWKLNTEDTSHTDNE